MGRPTKAIFKAVKALGVVGLTLGLLGCAPSVSNDRCVGTEFCPPAARKGNYRTEVPLALAKAKENTMPADEVIKVLSKSGYTLAEVSLGAYEDILTGAKKYRVDAYLKPRWLNNNSLNDYVVTAFVVSNNRICQVGIPKTIVEGPNIIKPNMENIYGDC